MIKHFKFFRILFSFGIAISIVCLPTSSFAQEDPEKGLTAKEIDQAWNKKCVTAQKTSKDKEASDEDRVAAKKIYKACKKEARKKQRAQCIPTSTRINRC